MPLLGWHAVLSGVAADLLLYPRLTPLRRSNILATCGRGIHGFVMYNGFLFVDRPLILFRCNGAFCFLWGGVVLGGVGVLGCGFESL